MKATNNLKIKIFISLLKNCKKGTLTITTPDNDVIIQMTLTTPNCPVADEMPKKVKEAVDAVPGVKNVAVDLVWDPPWDMSRMSDVARLELDMM